MIGITRCQGRIGPLARAARSTIGSPVARALGAAACAALAWGIPAAAQAEPLPEPRADRPGRGR